MLWKNKKGRAVQLGDNDGGDGDIAAQAADGGQGCWGREGKGQGNVLCAEWPGSETRCEGNGCGWSEITTPAVLACLRLQLVLLATTPAEHD